MTKKLVSLLTVTALAMTTLVGCGGSATTTDTPANVVIDTTTEETTPKNYLVHGVYEITDGGIIVTEDGNEWWWTSDDDHIVNNTMVVVNFSDNGTPDNIYDDEVEWCVKNYTGFLYDLSNSQEIVN